MSAAAVAAPLAQSDLTDEQLNEILHPEESLDTFTISDKSFRVSVLPFRWEKEFRRQTLPMLQAELKPLENLIFAFATELHLVKDELNIIKQVAETEVLADEKITDALLAILLSQDPTVLDKAAHGIELSLGELQRLQIKYRHLIEYGVVPEGETPRQYYRQIIDRQKAKHKMVDTLGESLLARCKEFASLAGMKQDFVTQLQASIQQRLNVSGAAMKPAATVAKSAGSSTESSSASSFPILTASPEAATVETGN